MSEQYRIREMEIEISRCHLSVDAAGIGRTPLGSPSILVCASTRVDWLAQKLRDRVTELEQAEAVISSLQDEISELRKATT